MSDPIKHECGIALVRLLKPLEYYLAKYGTSFYGQEKMYLLMQKQQNRGHDGAGIACIKMNPEPGQKYINLFKSNADQPIKSIFSQIYSQFQSTIKRNPDRIKDVQWLKWNFDFTGELFLGHLRYGTFGKNSAENLHPMVRENNWITRNLLIAGNFNLTNVDELFERLIGFGQFPTNTSDTITVLENIGHFLDEENEALYREFKKQGFTKKDITSKIIENLNIPKILQKSSEYWDGGYTIAGLLGHGDAFVIRDPSGIRPAFYFHNDEIIVAASERPVIQTALNVSYSSIRELAPGSALVIKANGDLNELPYKAALPKKACSFERIYFSRGNDKDIYAERKMLGKLLTPSVLKSIDHDLENTVFSYIPNTAAVAFRGMSEELYRFCSEMKKEKILRHSGQISPEQLGKIMSFQLRCEEIAVKDVKLRTFITEDNQRNDLVAHIYDVTYGVIRKGLDNLVILDDSIVRGTTLKQSIIRILDRLGPKLIVVVSSAPQIRYPDCYGIDMTRLSDFIAFRAAIELLNQTGQKHIINEVYRKCKEQMHLPKEEQVNHVKEIYKPFTAEQISEKISEMLVTPELNARIKIVYQTIENLHEACPNHAGDWYFTGNYPTPGGNKVVTRSFINYIEGKGERAY